MKRAVIVGGAEIRDYDVIKEQLGEEDVFIFCDSGLAHAKKLGVRPSLLIGDFDSHPQPRQLSSLPAPSSKQEEDDSSPRSMPWTEEANYGKKILHTWTEDGCEMIVLPRKKDWTDTYYAAEEAVRRGFKSVLVIGASGGRPDHYLANISLLAMLEKRDVEAWAADDISLMRVLSAKNGRSALVEDSCRFFSLLAYDGPARGVRIRNALYPLEDAVITSDNPYAVSNEVLPGRIAEVSIREGSVVLIVIRHS